MFTIRNLGGAALFLFGTTYLWLTPAFAGPSVDTSGVAWSVVQVLALLTILGFSIATYALFKKTVWWERLSVGSAMFGFAPVIAFLVAAHGAVRGFGFTAGVEVLGNLGVVTLLRMPRLEHWVSGHVVAGR